MYTRKEWTASYIKTVKATLSLFAPKRQTSSASLMISANASGFRQSMKKKTFWLHRLSSSAGLVGKPSPQMFSSAKHCNFSIRTWWGKPLKARNSSTGVVCCPKHVWCQCKTLRPCERNLNQDRKHQIAFHWEQLQMLTTRSLFGGAVGIEWEEVEMLCLATWGVASKRLPIRRKQFNSTDLVWLVTKILSISGHCNCRNKHFVLWAYNKRKE